MQPVADRVVTLLEPYVERIEIAGSIRRSRPEAGDIEIVCIPKKATLEFGSRFPDAVRNYLGSEVAGGEQWHYRLNSRGHGTFGESNAFMLLSDKRRFINVDIFMTTPEAWGTVLFVRTGPREFITAACTRANRLGFSLKPQIGLVPLDSAVKAGFKDGVIWCEEERQVFEALAIPWREPASRTPESAKELLSVFHQSA